MKLLPAISLLAFASATLDAQSPSTNTSSPATPAVSPKKVYTTPPAAIAPIPEADLASIKSAIPAKASASPKHPRKLLLFYRAEGFVHPSIPYGVETLRQLGEKTGAYTTVASDDMAMFEPGKLDQFDAVAFINSTQLKFENPVHRKTLLDFVASGKGVVGIHAASDNFPTWPEGQELMGGVFHGHPWHAGDLVAIKLDDPAHPINAGFNKTGFRLREEIYQITGPYGRDKQRELVSLDMSKPENLQKTVDKDGKPLLDKGGKPLIVRTDNDFPISWIKKEGGGRVFYTSLGHNKDIYFVPGILRHFLDGIQYATGDLPADDIPTAALKVQPVPALAPEGSEETLQKVKAAAEPPKVAAAAPPAASPTPSQTAQTLSPQQIISAGEASLKDLPKYNYGDATDALYNVLEAIRNETPEARAQLEPKLVEILKDSTSTPASKQTLCRWLGWMGGEDAVPVLAKLAEAASQDTKNADAVTGNFAVSALATIPQKSADQALVHLLSSGEEGRRLATMSAVGIRGVTSAIPQLSKIASMKSPVLAEAALQTLASLHTAEALEAILKSSGHAENLEARDRALIDGASRYLQSGGSTLPDAVVKRIEAIASSDSPYPLPISALRVLFAAHLPEAMTKATALLKSDDYRVRVGAAASIAEFASPEAVASVPWSGTLEAWVVCLQGLSRKAVPKYLPVFQNALASGDAVTRLAAIPGISRCGDDKTMDTLAPLLSETNAPVVQAAKAAIAGLKGEGVGDRLIALEESSEPPVAAILLSVLADRQDRKATDLAIAATASTNPVLQAAGFEALSRLASSGDLGKSLALIATVKGKNAESFQKALVRSALLDPSPSAAAAQIVGAFERGDGPQKEILINVLARLEVKEANDKLESILGSQDIEQRKQAIRALSSARSEASLSLLPKVAAEGQSNSEKILALKGFIDSINTLPSNEMNRRFALYLAAWKLAARDEEKAAIRDAVKKIPAKKIPSTKESKELQSQLNAAAAPAGAVPGSTPAVQKSTP